MMKASHSKSTKHKPIRVKVEKSDTKQIQVCPDDKDLTFYVKDRVELMRQVFSILKDRELLAMAPNCLRGLKVDGLQEALLDEVLGISSKRLRSILEGLECPSNTDSSEESSADALETISLDSISSDEDDILSTHDHKSKKKHVKKKSKLDKEAKKKNKTNDELLDNDNASRAKKNKKDGKENQKIDDVSGTGMTVLELLELQARARAIRAQLAAVEIKDTSNNEEENDSAQDSSDNDEDEVVIKEEPPEIVEIQSSSDDDTGNNTSGKQTKKHTSGTQRKGNSNQTKSGQSSLSPVIQVNSNNSQDNQSQSKPRKIKLNRTNLLVSVTNNSKTVTSGPNTDLSTKSVPSVSPNGNASDKSNSGIKNVNKDKSETSKINSSNAIGNSVSIPDPFDKANLKSKNIKSSISNKNIDKNDQALLEKIKNSYNKSKITPKKKPIVRERKESEEDEITLELSDTEKMDLLEGFHSPKSFETEDIEINLSTEKEIENCSAEIIDENSISVDNTNTDVDDFKNSIITEKSVSVDIEVEVSNVLQVNNEDTIPVNLDSDNKNSIDQNNIIPEVASTKNTGIKRKKTRNINKKHKTNHPSEDRENKTEADIIEVNKSVESGNKDPTNSMDDDLDHNPKSTENQDNDSINKSDGECSYSSEGIVIENENQEILCISDEHVSEDSNDGTNRQYRKRSNLSSDDEIQIPKETTEEFPKECVVTSTKQNDNINENPIEDILTEDKVYPVIPEPVLGTEVINDQTKIDEVTSSQSVTNITSQDKNEDNADCIFEISDDSEGEVSDVLSKEPTREEIEELSRKIDYEIDRENLNIIGDSNINLKITEDEQSNSKEEMLEGVSWKTRWLKSDKVQRVLATSNLCNALRKKNKELKKKLENDQIKKTCLTSDKVEETTRDDKTENIVPENKNEHEDIEGSVSQYEKLSGSTKYVNPVVEQPVDEKTMVTDAKVLMKMYKKLLKMHDLDEGEKKKAKKQKKEKKKDKKEKKKNKLKVVKSSELPKEENTTQENIESSANS